LKERIEAVYVCSPTELAFYSEHKDHLERRFGVTVLVNPPSVVAIGSDKLATANFLRDSGLPYPHTCLASDEPAAKSLIERCGFPLIVKPRLGASSKNVFTINSRQQLDAAMVLVPDLVVQELLPDATEEHTAATLSGPDRRVRAIIVLRRDLIQGTTYRTELVEIAKLQAKLIEIVEKLGAVGPCNVQFRMRDNVPVAFEFNPRFSGTSGIRFRYGFNDAELAFELFRVGHEVRQPTLRPAVVLRCWDEVVVEGASFASLRQDNPSLRKAS